jgi:hypothetical protein
MILLTAVVGYVGINVGRVYFRYYAFEDQMRQSARFAGELSDSAILSRLTFSADSLGLPPAALRVQIVRSGRTISISSDYTETVDLRVYTHRVRFNPKVVASY